MRTVQHDRARHGYLRRVQASIQSDVEYRPIPMSGIKGRFVVSDEAGEPERTSGRVAQIANRKA